MSKDVLDRIQAIRDALEQLLEAEHALRFNVPQSAEPDREQAQNMHYRAGYAIGAVGMAIDLLRSCLRKGDKS